MVHEIFFDTNALIHLAKIEERELHALKMRIAKSGSIVSVSHVQIDESSVLVKFQEKATEKNQKEVESYEQKIAEALKSLTMKGIEVLVEPTKICVQGIARQGYAVEAGKELGELYNELRNEISACEKSRGRPKNLLNIACDATIAVSSFGHDFFVTTDRCLHNSWHKVIEIHKISLQQFKLPTAIYCGSSTKEVVDCILELL
jgi:predicted nucleic acid-binding protein